MTEPKYTTTIKHLDFFESNIPTLLSCFQNSMPNSVQWFTLGMLERILNVSMPLKILLKEYLRRASYDFSIGIILRPVILDSIIGLNLYKILNEGLNENLSDQELIQSVDSFCNSILADGMIKTLKYIKDLEKYEFTDTNQLNEMYNQFSQEYADFLIQPDGINTMPKPKHKIDSTAISQFKKLAEDENMKNIGRRLHDLYVIYSKYDHFGYLSVQLNNNEKEIKSDRISAAVSFLVNHYTNLCDILQRATPNNSVINRIFLEAKEYLSRK